MLMKSILVMLMWVKTCTVSSLEKNVINALYLLHHHRHLHLFILHRLKLKIPNLETVKAYKNFVNQTAELAKIFVREGDFAGHFCSLGEF